MIGIDRKEKPVFGKGAEVEFDFGNGVSHTLLKRI